MRRVVYFLTVFATAFVVFIPFFVIYAPSFGLDTVGRFVNPVVNGAASFLPSALEPWFAPPSGTAVRLSALAALVGAGLLVYVIAIFALGVIDRRQLRGLLRRNPSTGPA